MNPTARNQVTILGINSLFGKVVSFLLKQSPVANKLVLYDEADTRVAHDIAEIPTPCKVVVYNGEEQLRCAVRNSSVILIGDNDDALANEDDAIRQKAGNIVKYANAISSIAPYAIVLIAATPVNSLLPLFTEAQIGCGSFDSNKVLGVTSADTMRASTLLARHMGIEPEKAYLPVIGGSSADTRIPLFSQSRPVINASKDVLKSMTRVVKMTDDELTRILNRREALNKAYATVQLIDSVMSALRGQRNISEIVLSKTNLVPNVDYFSLPVILGPRGIAHRFPLPSLTERESVLLDHAVKHIEIDKAKGINALRREHDVPQQPEMTEKYHELITEGCHNDLFGTLLEKLKLKSGSTEVRAQRVEYKLLSKVKLKLPPEAKPSETPKRTKFIEPDTPLHDGCCPLKLPCPPIPPIRGLNQIQAKHSCKSRDKSKACKCFFPPVEKSLVPCKICASNKPCADYQDFKVMYEEHRHCCGPITEVESTSVSALISAGDSVSHFEAIGNHSAVPIVKEPNQTPASDMKFVATATTAGISPTELSAPNLTPIDATRVTTTTTYQPDESPLPQPSRQRSSTGAPENPPHRTSPSTIQSGMIQHDDPDWPFKCSTQLCFEILSPKNPHRVSSGQTNTTIPPSNKTYNEHKRVQSGVSLETLKETVQRVTQDSWRQAGSEHGTPKSQQKYGEIATRSAGAQDRSQATFGKPNEMRTTKTDSSATEGSNNQTQTSGQANNSQEQVQTGPGHGTPTSQQQYPQDGNTDQSSSGAQERSQATSNAFNEKRATMNDSSSKKESCNQTPTSSPGRISNPQEQKPKEEKKPQRYNYSSGMSFTEPQKPSEKSEGTSMKSTAESVKHRPKDKSNARDENIKRRMYATLKIIDDITEPKPTSSTSNKSNNTSDDDASKNTMLSILRERAKAINANMELQRDLRACIDRGKQRRRKDGLGVLIDTINPVKRLPKRLESRPALRKTYQGLRKMYHVPKHRGKSATILVKPRSNQDAKSLVVVDEKTHKKLPSRMDRLKERIQEALKKIIYPAEIPADVKLAENVPRYRPQRKMIRKSSTAKKDFFVQMRKTDPAYRPTTRINTRTNVYAAKCPTKLLYDDHPKNTKTITFNNVVEHEKVKREDQKYSFPDVPKFPELILKETQTMQMLKEIRYNTKGVDFPELPDLSGFMRDSKPKTREVSHESTLITKDVGNAESRHCEPGSSRPKIRGDYVKHFDTRRLPKDSDVPDMLKTAIRECSRRVATPRSLRAQRYYDVKYAMTSPNRNRYTRKPN